MVPTIAAVTILGKFQNDIKNSESLIIDELYRKIDADNFKFDKVRPFISLNSKNLMEGQTLTAQIAVGAYSSTVNPTIVVNGQTIQATEGLGTFSMPVGGVGDKTISGTITLPKPDGQMETYNFSEAYSVGASTTSISADKMNVLYIGLANPISISAAGVPAEAVNASISVGNIRKQSAGNYVVTVANPGRAIINVVANVDGKTKSMKGFSRCCKARVSVTGWLRLSRWPLRATVFSICSPLCINCAASAVKYALRSLCAGLLACRPPPGLQASNVTAARAVQRRLYLFISIRQNY